MFEKRTLAHRCHPWGQRQGRGGPRTQVGIQVASAIADLSGPLCHTLHGVEEPGIPRSRTWVQTLTLSLWKVMPSSRPAHFGR